MRLALRDDLYFCLTDRGAIFLDLASNRYFGLSGTADVAFRRIVAGDRLDRSLERDLRPLLANGLLHQAKSVTAFALPVLAQPVSSFRGGDTRPAPQTVGAALAAHAAVRLEMRVLGLKAMIRRRQSRKSSAHDRIDLTTSPAFAARVLAAHRKIDRIVGAENRCLPRSLAMIDHLAAWGIYPDLVIGIRTGAFAAHCWVQHEAVLFNDDLDRVTLFTPIMIL